MTATGLIPRKRLRWIPPAERLAHEYCYFLHDQCVAVLVEYERAEGHLVRFKFKSRKELETFQRIAEATDAVTALRTMGRHDAARRVVINTITLALVSDCMHHVFEALKCMEKRKFVVALNLLRKPLLDSLLFLSWMLGDEAGFFEAFTEQSPQALTTKSLGNRRLQIITSALENTSLVGVVDPGDIKSTLFDAANLGGLYWLMQRAVHLVTTQRIELATEPENFNFIFKSHRDDDIYVGLYNALPTVQLYLAHVVIELFNRMQPMDDGAKLAFTVRTTFGYHLVEKEQVPEIQRRLSTLSEHFPCAVCGAEPIFTPHNAARAVLTESIRCNRCRRVTRFPFAWLF